MSLNQMMLRWIHSTTTRQILNFRINSRREILKKSYARSLLLSTRRVTNSKSIESIELLFYNWKSSHEDVKDRLTGFTKLERVMMTWRNQLSLILIRKWRSQYEEYLSLTLTLTLIGGLNTRSTSL